MTQQQPNKTDLLDTVVIVAMLLAMGLIGATALFAQGAQPVTDRGAFVVRRGTDTLVVERFALDRNELSGSLDVKGQPHTEYSVALGAGWATRSMQLRSYRVGATPDEAPTLSLTITFRGDTAVLEGSQSARIPTKAGAVPLLNNSFAMFEILTRRARASDQAVDIPVFALAGGSTLVTKLRPVGTDSMDVFIAAQEQQFRVDAAGRILGGRIVGSSLEIARIGTNAAAGITVGRANYDAPDGAPYTAEEVSLRGPGGFPLGGTLTLPKNPRGRVPAIVTITGSGQQDRDEFIAVAGGYRPFRQVADTLGRRGIAVLRLDDRAVGASGGSVGTSADYAEDIRAALAWLRTRKEIDATRLGVLGHSEGGLIGPIVAAAEPNLKVIVILAGPSENGLDIIHYQQRYAIDHDSAIAPAKRDSAARAVAKLFDSTSATNPWLKFFVSYDPLPTARRVKASTLILQGETDRQVTAVQAERLGAEIRAGGNRDVTVHVFPQLNHLFIHDPDGNPSGYAKLPTNKMSADVLGMIADWTATKLRAAPTP